MLRRLFASATPASAAATPGRSGGPPADVDELIAPLGRPGLAAAGDVAPDVLPTAGAGAHDVGRWVEVLAAAVRPADRTRTFTLALGDLIVAGR